MRKIILALRNHSLEATEIQISTMPQAEKGYLLNEYNSIFLYDQHHDLISLTLLPFSCLPVTSSSSDSRDGPLFVLGVVSSILGRTAMQSRMHVYDQNEECQQVYGLYSQLCFILISCDLCFNL